MPTSDTRECGDWATYSDSAGRTLLQHFILTLEASGIDPDDYDLDAAVEAYRDAVNARLPKGITWAANGSFHAPANCLDPWTEVRQALAAVDQWEVLAANDLTAAPE